MENKNAVLKMFDDFEKITISELEEEMSKTSSRETKIFCRAIINLKLQLTQEKIIGEALL